jgi:hypothetical protein
MPLTHRHMNGKLIPVLRIDQLRIAIEQGAHPRHITGPAGAKKRPSLVAVHRLDAVLILVGLHFFGLQQTGHALGKAFVTRRSLSR